MKTQKAIRLAIKALQEYRKHFIFDANAAKFGFDNPVNQRAVMTVAEIDEAVRKLEELEREEKKAGK